MGRTKITYSEYQKFPRGESNHGFHAKPSYCNRPIGKQNINKISIKESKLILKLNNKGLKL